MRREPVEFLAAIRIYNRNGKRFFVCRNGEFSAGVRKANVGIRLNRNVEFVFVAGVFDSESATVYRDFQRHGNGRIFGINERKYEAVEIRLSGNRPYVYRRAFGENGICKRPAGYVRAGAGSD